MPDDQYPEHTAIPMRSPYEDVPVNGSITLYSGPIRLQWNSGTSETKGTSESKGTIELNLQGKPDIRFDATLPEPFAFIEMEGNLQSDLDSLEASIPYIMLEKVVSSSVSATKANGIIHGEGLIIQERKADGKPEPVERIQFHLINSLEYRGTTLKKVLEQDRNQWPGRVTFFVGKWEVTLDQFQDIENRLKEAEALKGNILTHIGVLCRKDKKLFDPNDATGVFEALYWFLSFMNGARCAFAVPIGLRNIGRPLWQNWGIYNITPVNFRQYWFSENATEDCFNAANLFYTCWQMADKREWLNRAIGLYLASNQNNSSIELALANSQILLEMLTWVALQEENTLMSNESFEKLPAADKIRSLLFWLGIPTFHYPTENRSLQLGGNRKATHKEKPSLRQCSSQSKPI